MRSPYQRPNRLHLRWWQLALMALGVVLIVQGWNALRPSGRPSEEVPLPEQAVAPDNPDVTPTLPDNLTRRDVLPTPTVDPNAIPRSITFPGALLTSRVINAARTVTSWETRYLGSSVGHLEGTSWIGGSGGNIVMAGHVTTELGEPGPFAYLFEAQIGDDVILTDGNTQYHYYVASIERVPPDAIGYVAQDGRPRLTLITCDDWDYSAQRYNSRLVVVAEPAPPAQASGL